MYFRNRPERVNYILTNKVKTEYKKPRALAQGFLYLMTTNT